MPSSSQPSATLSVTDKDVVARDQVHRGVPTTVLRQGAALYIQNSAINRLAQPYPTWFVGVELACAYCARKSVTAEDKPVRVQTTREVRLVQLPDNATVQALEASLQQRLDEVDGLRKSALVITDDGNADRQKQQRAVLRKLSYEQKRLNKMLTAVKFATGVSASKEDQEEILTNVFSSPQQLRQGFGTDDGKRNNASVTLAETVFGNDTDHFNRISIAKYDYCMATAIKETFAWADGYIAHACPSTWHVNQLYPSEVCVFCPGSVVDVDAVTPVPNFEDVMKHISDSKTTVAAITAPLPHTYNTRIYIGPKPARNAPGQAGGATSAPPPVIDLSVEQVLPQLDMDNPLVSNDTNTLDANLDTWVICPPPGSKR